MTKINESLAFSQNLPTPISLKDVISVELALVHKYGIFTT